MSRFATPAQAGPQYRPGEGSSANHHLAPSSVWTPDCAGVELACEIGALFRDLAGRASLIGRPKVPPRVA